MIRKKENEKAIYNGEENSMPTGQAKDRSQTLKKNQENTINRTN